ncbi:MAG: glycosyltransferase family 39 protein, partial [Anaerolineales bacterium]
MGVWARLGRQGLPALLIVYTGLTLAYNFTFPPQEPSDEPAHYRYVRWLLDEHSLPVARPDEGSEFHQPPLYYALAGLFAWPVRVAPNALPQLYDIRSNPHRGYHYWEPGPDNKNLWLHGPWDLWPFPPAALSVHLARLASLVCGLVTVYAAYHAARLFFETAAALAAAAVVAFNPMFLAVSASLQNDAGAAATGAVAIWICLVGLRRGFTARRALLLGLVPALGALMKITAIFLLPAAVL